MKNVIIVNLALLLVLMGGCKKPAPEPTKPAPEPAKDIQQPVDKAAVKEEVAPAAPVEMVAIPLVLPKPMFVGTPQNLSGIPNLEPATKKARAAFLAPAGVTNLALGKEVTSSEMDPIIGTLDMLTDGEKGATEENVVELGPFEQWVQVDLGDKYEIYAIAFWHYHKTARVYFDVIVQVSNDAEFIMDVTTVFNNDIDNSLGMGIGTDKHYIDAAEGKLVDAKGNVARYVRLYSQGNNQNDYSHSIEVEVFGK